MVAKTTHKVETIAKICDLSVRRVQQLAKDGVMSKSENGRYPISAVTQYIQFLKDRNLSPQVISLDKVRARKTLADAEMAEIELAKTKGELIEVETVMKDFAEIIGAAKTKLLSIPIKLAPIVSVEDSTTAVKSLLELEINEALHELSRGIKLNTEPMETAATVDSQPMGGSKKKT
jgi:hypothetical protein